MNIVMDKVSQEPVIYSSNKLPNRFKKFILSFFKNKKILISIVSLAVAYLVYLGTVNVYQSHKYAFIIDGHKYTKTEILNLISTPKKLDNRTDYGKQAYSYYKYIIVADKLNVFYSKDSFDQIKEQNASKYNLPKDTNNSWVNLESKYLTIKSYVDTKLIRSANKTGFFCEFNFLHNGTNEKNSSEMISAMNYLKDNIKYQDSNMYNIDEILKTSSNYSKYHNLMSNGYCLNFGYNNEAWFNEVKTNDIIESIKVEKMSGVSSIKVGQDGGNQSYDYFYNLINNPGSNNVDTNSFLSTLSKVKGSYYGL